MKTENHDFASLIETWILLETESAKLAALRRTKEDIETMQKAQKVYADKVKSNLSAVEEDLMFHLKIADASKNSTLKSLLLTIMPDILKIINQTGLYKNLRAVSIIIEHEKILNNIVAREPLKAEFSMQQHLKDLMNYSKDFRDGNENGSNGWHN